MSSWLVNQLALLAFYPSRCLLLSGKSPLLAYFVVDLSTAHSSETVRAQQGVKEGPFWVQITLCVPWLAPQDQALVFPNGITFQRPEQQEEYVREWARKRTGLPCDFQIKFYPGRYAVEKCSILPVGDPTSYIPDKEVT